MFGNNGDSSKIEAISGNNYGRTSSYDMNMYNVAENKKEGIDGTGAFVAGNIWDTARAHGMA